MLYPAELQPHGASWKVRTPDHPVRSRMLWSTELKGQGEIDVSFASILDLNGLINNRLPSIGP
jgi:hypothetical protein